MAYFVPIRMLKIGPYLSIPIHRIVAIGSIGSNYVKQLVKMEKKKKTLIDATGSNITKSVIFLDNGAICTSTLEVEALDKYINKMQREDMKESGYRISRTVGNTKSESDTTTISIDELMKTIKETIVNGDEEEDEAGDDDRDSGEI